MSAASVPASNGELFEVAAAPGTPIGKRLMLVSSEGRRAVFMRNVAIYVFDAADRAAESACIAMLSRAGLASDIDIAAAFGCHRNTVARLAGRLDADGMSALLPAKRGPKGPHKVTAAVRELVASNGSLTAPALVGLIAERTGVRLSVAHARRLRNAEFSRRQQEFPVRPEAAEPVVEPDDPDDVRAAEGGDTDTQPGESWGVEPPVTLPGRVVGRYMGLALYYPAITSLGLVEVARSVFRLPRSERFGVRAVTLSLLFMTLLRKTTVESAKHLRRREFGAVVGSGRAPAVKTLRRKLDELAGQARAAEFGVRLARRWVNAGLVATAYLYVDGHMKAYTGKRRLAEVWNSQRRMPLPALHSYFVGDVDGRPLLTVTEPLSANLAKAMPRVVAAIREVLGDRTFTVVFDRGGYDGRLFAWLRAEHIDFITYQRGHVALPADAFTRRETRFEGRRVRFALAEDEVKVAGTGPWRRIVLRTKDGHQTPILTSLGPRHSVARIACLMLARWRQENLFKYMGEHHGLDRLISYHAEPADPEQLVPNPERRRLTRLITEKRKQAAALRAQLGDAVLDEPKTGSRSAHGVKVSQRGLVRDLRALDSEVEALRAQRKAAPAQVPTADLGKGRDVMRLEHKNIVDRIKISAYNAEEWLLDRLVRHYPNPHDVRDLLRSFAELSGEIRTTERGVTVTLDPPDTPKHQRALQGLIDDLNAAGTTFPGTDVPVTYQVAMHKSATAA